MFGVLPALYLDKGPWQCILYLCYRWVERITNTINDCCGIWTLNFPSTLWTCCAQALQSIHSLNLSSAVFTLWTCYTQVQRCIHSLNLLHTSLALYPLSEPVAYKFSALSTLWTCCTQVQRSIHSLNLLYSSSVLYPLSEPVPHKSSALSTLWTCCTQVQSATLVLLRECCNNIVGMFNFDFTLKIGYHVGEVVSGVLGTSKLHFDIWGNTVNVSSRMYSTGVKGKSSITI